VVVKHPHNQQQQQSHVGVSYLFIQLPHTNTHFRWPSSSSPSSSFTESEKISRIANRATQTEIRKKSNSVMNFVMFVAAFVISGRVELLNLLARAEGKSSTTRFRFHFILEMKVVCLLFITLIRAGSKQATCWLMFWGERRI